MMKKVLLLIAALLVGAGLAFSSTIPVIQEFKLSVGQVPSANQVSVKSRDLNLVCPGALQVSGGRSGAKLGAFAPLNTALVSTYANTATGAIFEARTLGSDSVTGIPERITEALSITAKDEAGTAEQGSKLLSANQIQLASEPSIAGLAGAQCQMPSHDLWLIGGNTTVGREALLVLTNPSSVDAALDIEIYNEAGKAEGTGLNGFAVAANKSALLQLSSVVPKSKSFAIHVSSRGGAVAAWVQQKVVRGLAATGVDYVSPDSGFATSQFLPGLLIRGTKSATKLAAKNDDFADLAPSLRVFVPGGKMATVTAQILGSNQKSFGTVIQQTVGGRKVVDIPITGLADGDYVAVLNSTEPIAASITFSRTDSAKNPVSDIAILADAQASNSPRTIRVPSSGISKLSLVNGSKKTATVTLTAAEKSVSFKLNDAASKVVELSPGALVSVSSDQPVAASMVIDLNGAVTAIPLTDYKNAKGQVAVSVR
jgi:hypothetical protein